MPLFWDDRHQSNSRITGSNLADGMTGTNLADGTNSENRNQPSTGTRKHKWKHGCHPHTEEDSNLKEYLDIESITLERL